MPHPVVHWEIAVKDYPRAKEFYSKLFDWQIDDDNPMKYGMVNPGGLGGGLFKAEGDVPNYVTIYVEVDDLQKYLDQAVELGGKTIIEPTPIPEMGAFAMFTDPSGNCIGLFKGK
jgi:predicted enzyme related to lactoylglutathione lyase